ncbi:MAG: PEGA domain-containing protein [Deltaproteobacteria bacterium]|nr:PEGA domain-containing protein [Deltaproteobacteria bacterium]
MIFKTPKFGLSFLGILAILFLLSLPAPAGADTTDLILGSSSPGTILTPVQYYPYRYPPGYYPPAQDPYRGTKGSPGSGWIVIEVEPPEAAVFIDGHKLEPREDNTYEEGVLAGRHKVEAKKGGYRDYVRFVDVPPGVKESLTIQLKKIEQ